MPSHARSTHYTACVWFAMLGGFFGCHDSQQPNAPATTQPSSPLASPDGQHLVITWVDSSNPNPAKKGCVVFELKNSSGDTIHTVETGASDFSKWAIGWTGNETIVLQSSDIGTQAWVLSTDGDIDKLEPPLPANLEQRAKALKAAKYGESLLEHGISGLCRVIVKR